MFTEPLEIVLRSIGGLLPGGDSPPPESPPTPTTAPDPTETPHSPETSTPSSTPADTPTPSSTPTETPTPSASDQATPVSEPSFATKVTTPAYYVELWRYLNVVYLGLVSTLGMFQRYVDGGRFAEVYETRFVLAIGVWFGVFCLSLFVGGDTLPVATRRLVTVTWVFSVPLFVGTLAYADRRVFRLLVAAFVVLNVLTLPFFVLHGDLQPNQEYGERDYAFSGGDHAAGEWVETYGTSPVASAANHKGIWAFYSVGSFRPYPEWVMLPDGRASLKPGYLYMSPETSERFPLRGMAAQRPPDYQSLPYFDKVYSTEDGWLYRMRPPANTTTQG